MPHHTPLIGTVVAGLVLAFLFGTAANRLRISPLVGYLLAGILVGPYTPGFVADQPIATELAELGVILLMFGVGLHFSLQDLLSVKSIAIPGAILQTALSTLVGMGIAKLMGWTAGTGFVFGLALSIASTVVMTRSLQERRLMQTERGKIAIGWLVVQDLLMVIALVLIPSIAEVMNAKRGGIPYSPADLGWAVAITMAKAAGFIVLMFVVGKRVIPEILHYIVHTGSRELFRLAVLVIALGVAYGASEWFGISFALGAFFAGMILSESTLSQRAAEETLPLRDAFAVLFFVSVGMLFNPSILLSNPFTLLGTLFVVLIFNPVAAYCVVRLFKQPIATAITIGASLAQIGEFSFVLASLGIALKILPQEGQDLILAAAIISIFLNPIYFAAVTRLKNKLQLVDVLPSKPAAEEPEELKETTLANHAVIIGYGRVGTILGTRLREENHPFLVIEDRKQTAETIRQSGTEVIQGNAADPRVIKAANLAGARWLFIAIPDGFEAGQVAEQARKLNPKLDIIARAHSDAEVEHLQKHKANFVIMGEREIAFGMLEHALGSGSGNTAPAA
jgi:CPA2 family monovalent cation:H+ antiporter-2